MQARQVGVRLLAAAGAAPAPAEVIAALHRFIQLDLLDELMIDVVDYGHVHHGPGTLLIVHGGEYGVGRAGGRLGVHYRRRRDEPGPLGDKLAAAAARLLTAALELERALGGRLPLRGDRLEVRIDDRLLAPGGDATAARARPALEALARRLFGDTPVEIRTADDPRRPFTAELAAAADPGLEALRARLARG